MTTSLLDGLKAVATPELTARLASSLGEPSQNVATGLDSGMSSMLMGTLNKCDDPSAFQQIFSTITNSANDGRVLDDPAALVGSPADSPMASLGRQFLSGIFGPRASAVNDVVAKHSGLRLGSVSSLLQLAAPLVLGVLGKRIRDTGLNIDSFKRLLTEESDGIQHAAPPGLMSALGVEQRAAEAVPVYDATEREGWTKEPARTYAAQPEPSGGRRWFWPTAALVAALALLWGVWPRHRTPEITLRDTSRTATSGGEVVPPVSVTPGMAKLQLPGGTILSVPEASAEARLVGFLTDPSRAPDDTTWFVLDELQFDRNTAKLRPESSAQLDRVAQVLKAYPNASVKIGGFTDNTGSASANKKMSRERADAARMVIVRDGIQPARITAEGYGPEHPRADNSTDAGRTQNRRVAILVVKK